MTTPRIQKPTEPDKGSISKALRESSEAIQIESQGGILTTMERRPGEWFVFTPTFEWTSAIFTAHEQLGPRGAK